MSQTRSFSWKELDEYATSALSNVVTLEVIGRFESKSRAADEIDITATGVNSRLSTLSKALKATIVEPKTSQLTPLGLQMRQLWSKVQDPLKAFIIEADRLRDIRVLDLGVIQSVRDAESSWLLKEYEQRRPGGVVRFKVEDGFKTIEHKVRTGDIDLGIASFAPPAKDIPPDIEVKEWRKEPMMLVMQYSRSLLLPTVLSKVAAERVTGLHQNIYLMEENTAMYKAVYDYLKLHRIKIPHKIPVKDIATALLHVLADDGISILPDPAIAIAAHGNMVDALELKPAFYRPLCAVYRKTGLKRDLVDTFLECMFLRKEYKRQTFPDDGPDLEPGV